MKKPKINVKLKMPDKKPTIKNRFLQKNLLSLIVIAVLAIGTGTAYGTLSSQDADRGNDPVNGVNQDRYQVLVSGKGYKLSKKQEKDYKLQKKQNEANVNKAAQDNPNVIRSSSGSRIFRSGSSSYRYSGGTYKPSKIPKLSTDILKRKKEKSTWKAGDKLSFIVTALAYPYGTKNAIPSDSIKVTINGKAVSCDNSDDGDNFYTVVLEEGTNTINISATDKKTKKTSKLGPYNIKNVGANSGSGGSTDPTGPTTPLQTNVAVKIEGFDPSLQSNPVEISENTSVYDVLKETPGVIVEDGEIYVVFNEFEFNENELKDIYEKDGANPEGYDYDTWRGKVTESVKDGDKDKIGPGCPFETTKWTATPESGKDLANGITLRLKLF